MTYIIIVTLALVAGGVITACALGVREHKRRKKEKEAFKKFKIDASEWEF